MIGKRRIFKKRFYYRKKNKPLSSGECALCGISSNESYLGQLFKTPQFVVHEHCLLFSPLLHQIFDPDKKRKGFIIGFKICDIEREIRRIVPLKCCICKGPRAGIGCYNNTCKKSFHLSCGLSKGAIGIFKDVFHFFCYDHASSQNVQTQLNSCEKIVPECIICLESLCDDGYEESQDLQSGNYWDQFLSKVNRRTVINGLCCARCWMHRGCIRQYALSAGLHHAKCPNCSDRSLFINSVQQCGIWLPNRDASWELEPGAYHELYDTPEMSPAHEIDPGEEVTNVSVSSDIVDNNPRVILIDAVKQGIVTRKRARTSDISPTKPSKRIRLSYKEESRTEELTAPNVIKKKPVLSTTHVRSKLSLEKIQQCRALLQEKIAQVTIANNLQLTQQTVSRIKLGFRYKIEQLANEETIPR